MEPPGRIYVDKGGADQAVVEERERVLRMEDGVKGNEWRAKRGEERSK